SGQLIAGPKLALDESVSNSALIDTLHTKLRGNEAIVREGARGGLLGVRLGTADVPPPDATFVTWSADENTPYYCVEPWMGPPTAHAHRRMLQLVPPGETGTLTVRTARK